MERFFEICVETGVSSSIKNSRFQFKQIFKNINLNNKSILDIGGGSGYLSFYCMLKGAKSAVCLEPGEDGVNLEKNASFETFDENFNYEIDYLNEKIEEYHSNQKFDVIILHNSINHLVECDCKNLNHNIDAKKKIMKTIEKISFLANYNSLLLIVDNSGYHFFQNFGLEHHPLIPHVGFHDHESPSFWIKLIEHYKYKFLSKDYITPNPLSFFGKIIFNNCLSSYFLGFPFRLIFKFKNKINI